MCGNDDLAIIKENKMSNEMMIAMNNFKCALESNKQQNAEQKWEAWKKVTWQTRMFGVKANNLKHRMRCL